MPISHATPQDLWTNADVSPISQKVDCLTRAGINTALFAPIILLLNRFELVFLNLTSILLSLLT